MSWNYPTPPLAFNSTGTVQVQSGTFDIYQGGSSSNASGFAVAAGATLLFTGDGANPDISHYFCAVIGSADDFLIWRALAWRRGVGRRAAPLELFGAVAAAETWSRWAWR
jgi:hypothetical protein